MRVDGGMGVHEARDDLGLAIPEGDYETVAGYVLSLLGHLPEAGEKVARDGFHITVLAVTDRKIDQVVITRINADAEAVS